MTKDLPRDQLAFAMRELKIWAQLRHKNILPLVGVLVEDVDAAGTGLLEGVSPWMKNGTSEI